MKDGDLTVADVGEGALLERIARALPPAPHGEIWQGDDAALVTSPGGSVLLTIDTMVQDVDFRLDYATGFDVGWKTVAANASDVAAMGGLPAHAVASLCLPGPTPVAVVDDLVSGLRSAAERFGVALVGGDLSEASELSLTLALLGAPGRRNLTRSGAAPDQAVCVTGALGGAAGGLALLRAGLGREGPEAAALVERQLRPQARVLAGVELAQSGASAAIDVSDGLAVDLGHLTDESEVGCEIDLDLVPVDPNLGWLEEALDFDPLRAALTGGEDFELLFTIDRSATSGLRDRLGEMGMAMSVIGRTTTGPARMGESDLSEWRKRGWEHLRNR